MRYLFIGLIAVFAALALLFRFRNFETATISIFPASTALSLSVLVLALYVLGMLTGEFLFARDRSHQAIGLKQTNRSLAPGGTARFSIHRIPIIGEAA